MPAQNFSQSRNSNFIFTADRLSTVQFDVTAVNIPGISASPSIQPTNLIQINRPGDHLVYDPVTISFLVDEQYQNWLQVYNWIQSIGVNSNESLPLMSDAHIIIQNNNKNDIMTIKFENLWPSVLGDIQLSTTDNDSLSCDCVFNYVRYSVSIP